MSWIPTSPGVAEVITRVALYEVEEDLEMTPGVQLPDVPPTYQMTNTTLKS